MYLFKINSKKSFEYDTYSSVIVCSSSLEKALTFHPNGIDMWDGEKWSNEKYVADEWDMPDNLEIVCIGKAGGNVPEGVVLASFRAG